MANIVKIRNVNRTNLRIGTTNIPAGTNGAVATPTQIDLDDRKVLRDLYRHIGRWVIVEDVGLKTAKVALLAGAIGNGTLFAWANPEGQAILVHKVLIDVVTPAALAATANVGKAANGTTSASTLISAGALNATAVLNSGSSADKVGTTEFITGSVAAQSAASLVGNAYIFYRAIA